MQLNNNKTLKESLRRLFLKISFLSELRNGHVTKDYWDECKMARNAFTPDDIHKMQMMCRHTDDNKQSKSICLLPEKAGVGKRASGMIKGVGNTDIFLCWWGIH